jgi:hypothetical protein
VTYPYAVCAVHLQARAELSGWQQHVSDATAQSEASAAALAAAQRQADELSLQLGEAQQGNSRLKEQLTAQVGGAV